MSVKSEPTVFPKSDFVAKDDTKKLRAAMKGAGSDDAIILDILTTRTNAQRQQIISAYSIEFDRDLMRDLKSELDGKFKNLILALMDSPSVYLAKQCHEAIAGIGTHEHVLNSILCTQTSHELEKIRVAYQQIYGKSFDKAIQGEGSGNYKKLLLAILTTKRDEETYPSRAVEQAKELYKAGEKKLGTDEKTFINTLTQASFQQIKLIMEEYKKVSKNSLTKAVKKEFSGSIQDALLTILKFSKNSSGYFAQQLESAMEGIGMKDEQTFVRVMVSRSEIDLGSIKKEYEVKYKKRLYNVVTAETKGVYSRQYDHIYKVAILKIIGDFD